MSYRIQDLVWQKAFDGRSATERFVLMSLAFRANESGACWPSLEGISRITNLNVKTVRASINALTDCGLIAKTVRPGAPALYTVNVAAIAALPDAAGDTKNGTPTNIGTPTKNGTPTNIGTPTKNGTPTEIGTSPLPNLGGVPLPKLVPEQVIQQVKEQVTTDIRPKLSDTAETVEDFGLEVETLKSEPPTFEEKGVDRTPVKFIVDTYNEVLGGVLGKVLKVTPARQQAMRNRYRDIYRDCECLNDEEAKDKVRKFFVCISRSDFLMGRTGRQGNHAAWMPNFDWLMQQKNYTKILEGVYDNGKR